MSFFQSWTVEGRRRDEMKRKDNLFVVRACADELHMFVQYK